MFKNLNGSLNQAAPKIAIHIEIGIEIAIGIVIVIGILISIPAGDLTLRSGQ